MTNRVGRPNADNPKAYKLSYRADEEEYKRVQEYADRNNTSITHILKAAVDEYLDSHKA